MAISLEVSTVSCIFTAFYSCRINMFFHVRPVELLSLGIVQARLAGCPTSFG